MEEDIKILEEMKNNCLTKRDYIDEKAERKAQAIENLINKYKEQEKIIKLMAKDISENDFNEDICRKVKNKTSEKDDCYGDDYDMCKDCVIEFYKKKASEKE